MVCVCVCVVCVCGVCVCVYVDLIYFSCAQVDGGLLDLRGLDVRPGQAMVLGTWRCCSCL